MKRPRPCEPTGRANARPMTGSAKQSISPSGGSGGLLCRGVYHRAALRADPLAPRNAGGAITMTAVIVAALKVEANATAAVAATAAGAAVHAMRRNYGPRSSSKLYRRRSPHRS